MGRTTQQGLMIHTTQYGDMPWWGGCWAWLNALSRKEAAEQLLAHGDTICLIQLPDGVPLYDEPEQFYSADKFGPLDMTHGNTQIDQEFIDLITEALELGFKGVWVFLGGDEGNHGGFFIAAKQTQMLGKALGPLNEYVMQVPGWDGVWPFGGTGYSREQIRAFAALAREAGALYVGVEHATGYAIAGEGRADFLPGGVCVGYDCVLGEFDDDRFDNSVWQLLARYLPPGTYVRPPEEPQDDDPRPPSYLPPDKVYRVFEFFIYGGVRGEDPAHIQVNRERFEAMGATNVC